MDVDRCVASTLYQGLDDWVSLPEVEWSVIRFGAPRDERDVRNLAVDQIKFLIASELMQPGYTPRGGPGFVPWHLPVDLALARVTEAAAKIERPSLFSDVCYLDLTPAGEATIRRACEQKPEWVAEFDAD